MKANIGLLENNTHSVTNFLSHLLADEFVLYTKTRNAHWNIIGQDFYPMHKLFEIQYEQLDDIIDEVAERIRAIGHYAPATLGLYLQLTHLTEKSRQHNDSAGYIKELLADHESIIIHLRENIDQITDEYKEAGTGDFITGLLKTHEKMAWFLRSHLA